MTLNDACSKIETLGETVASSKAHFLLLYLQDIFKISERHLFYTFWISMPKWRLLNILPGLSQLRPEPTKVGQKFLAEPLPFAGTYPHQWFDRALQWYRMGSSGNEVGQSGDRDRKSTRLNSSHSDRSRMPSSA